MPLDKPWYLYLQNPPSIDIIEHLAKQRRGRDPWVRQSETSGREATAAAGLKMPVPVFTGHKSCNYAGFPARIPSGGGL